MKASIVLLPLLANLLCGQTALAPPQVGFLENAGAVRFLFGIAGNFRLGDAVSKDVVSSAFSGSLGIVKTDQAISFFNHDGRMSYTAPAPPGPALFAFADRSESALIYLTEDGTLLHWSGKSAEAVPLEDTIAGEVLSIAQPSESQATLLVRRDDRFWLLRASLRTGRILTEHVVPGLTLAVLLLNDGGIVFAGSKGVTIRRSDGAETRFNLRLPSGVRLRRMGGGWFQLGNLRGSAFALRLEPGLEQLWQLPEPQP